MITELAKMGTGLMVRGGVGLLLRMSAFVMMSLVAWWAVRPIIEQFWGWAAENYSQPLVILSPTPLIIGAIITLSWGSEKLWGFWDFLRRMPFVCWCLITDDGNDVPLWAILSWPAVAFVEIIICAGCLIALPCWGLWRVLAVIGCAVWRILSIRPLDRGHRDGDDDGAGQHPWL